MSLSKDKERQEMRTKNFNQKKEFGNPKKTLGVVLPPEVAEKYQREASERQISVARLLAEKLLRGGFDENT